MDKPNYKALLPNITTFIFDVDGVLTNGKVLITTSGEMYREMDTKDGYALKCALVQGYKWDHFRRNQRRGARSLKSTRNL